MNSAKLLSKNLIQNGIVSRFYHTNRVNKATLYSRISPLGSLKSVEPELEDWLKNGNKTSFAEFQRIVRDLRKRRRFTQALEVSEWMNKKALCAFSPTEHAVQLDLIGRVRGFVSAESYFDNLKDQDKTEKTYGALLNCYVRQRQTDKSLSHLQKMKELGFASSPLTYNDIMCLYTNIGQHEKVPDVMREMKENKISPDNFSYRICINSYGVKSDLEGMERILMEMESQPHIKMDWNTYAVVANFYIKAGLTEKAIDALDKSEQKLDKKDGTGYNQLISLYASLGNKAEVLRLWGLEKDACKRCINKDFITMLQSLVKLDEFEEAEKIIKEWESSGNYYDFRVPNIVIIGYAEKGLHEKAEAMLEDLIGKGKGTTPNSWGVVATGYLDKGQVRKAFECMKAALSLTAVSKVWRPNLRVVTSILDWLGDEGNLQEVEDFVASLRTVMPVDRRMYVALLKANVRNGNGVDELLKLMKADKIDEDKETKAILSEAALISKMSKLLKKLGLAEGMPSECWELAFNRLNEDDLKSVSLVCKDFLATSNLVKKRLKPKHPDVTLLSRHLNRFTQLKEIDFIGFKGNLDEAICEIASSSGLVCLETLCFGRKSFKTQSLRELGSNPNMKKNLKHLNCGRTKSLHDNDLVVMANLFPNLEQLNIQNFPPTGRKHIFTNYGIKSLASMLKVLKKLSIAGGAHLFSDRSVIALSLNCGFLEHVDIHFTGSVLEPRINDSVKVTEHGIGLLLRNRPNLKHLSIALINKSLSNITIENSISHAKSLISLCFYCMDISDKLLMEIGKAKLQLKRFQIVFCRGFTVSGLCMLDYKYLHHLCIRDFDADILDLDAGIREMIILKEDIANLTCIDISSFEVTTSTLFLLSTKCSSLVHIRFRGAILSGHEDTNTPILSKNHKLQELQLCYSDITDELLERVGLMFPSLKVLSLDGCSEVTSRGIEAILKSCKYISELSLENYTKAKMIEANSEVAQVNLEELILEDSAIDDEGLAVIATKCPQLVHINLSGCREVTSNGIKQMLKNIKTLRRFSVGSEKVNSVELLEWMLSTGYLASLKEICFPKQTILTKGLKEAFMDRGCIIYFG
ncbi:hypothetical protein COLO4_31487 [Corchorus olitorius]|uniref:Leucine-rich repeat, cysteine-containing subtype n=1 Tax=Corchorus olitorius TaxID=93759 RepID=A0A1R3H4B9_9ROSI|nr:hypothetical protein COLO4_31487 [Corchorus olitorius]